MTLTGHLKELRNRLIVCAVVFVAAVVVTLAYADRLIDLLTAMGQGLSLIHIFLWISLCILLVLMRFPHVALLPGFHRRSTLVYFSKTTPQLSFSTLFLLQEQHPRFRPVSAPKWAELSLLQGQFSAVTSVL